MFSAIVNSKQLLSNVYINYFQARQMFALQKLDPKYYLPVRQDNNFLSWDLNTPHPPKIHSSALGWNLFSFWLPLTKSEWIAGE